MPKQRPIIQWIVSALISGLVVLSTLTAGVRASLADSGKTDPCAAGTTASITSDCSPNSNVYGIEMRAIAVEMAAHPRPDVTQIPIDVKKLFAHAYRKVLKATDIYSSPNGTVTGHMDGGFTFVNAGVEKDGFIQIRPNAWLPKDALGPSDSAVSKFSGVTLPDGMPDRQFGWMLLDTKPSQIPGSKPPDSTKTVKRYTLVNLFAAETVDGWEWYLIGPDQWVVQTHIARLQPAKRPDGVTGKWFAVDLYEQTLTAYDGDKAVFATLISSGLPQWPTDEGLFSISDRYAEIKMSGAPAQADFYYLPQVPWVMYFNPDEQALHGAYWHDGFGYRHSHGCVNMSVTDAAWAFNWTLDQPDAAVYIYHSGEYRSSAPR